jgi:hypothetical protein
VHVEAVLARCETFDFADNVRRARRVRLHVGKLNQI